MLHDCCVVTSPFKGDCFPLLFFFIFYFLYQKQLGVIQKWLIVFGRWIKKILQLLKVRDMNRTVILFVIIGAVFLYLYQNSKDNEIENNKINEIQKRGMGMSETEKKEGLAAMNAARCNLSPLPPAAKMPALVWDENLEAIAQKFVDTCPVTHNKNLPSNTGENMAWGYPSLAAAVKGWDSEKKYVNANLINRDRRFIFTNGNTWCSTSNSKEWYNCGHFTQGVWAGTTRVGCAKPSGVCQEWGRDVYVCNYSPAGNRFNGQVYEISTATGTATKTDACKIPK